MGAPVLIGAGAGALGSALTGNSPLKGAMLGGGLGAGYGGLQSLLQGGSFMGGAMPFMAETAKPVSTSLIAQGGGSTLPAYLPEAGINMSTGALVNPESMTATATDFAPAMLSVAPEAGGLTAAATSVPYLQQLGYTMDEIKSMLPEMSVGNVIGGANVYQQYANRRQVPQAPAGGISRGNPPSGTAVQELIAQMKPQQRKRISLLVG